MDRKLIIKFIIFDIIFIVLLLLTVKIYGVIKGNKENISVSPNTPAIKTESLVYKHFEYTMPATWRYMTDDYYIHLYKEEEWTAQIDMLLDENALLKDNSEEAKNDLRIRGFTIVDGPIDIKSKNVNYFYYKVSKDSTPHIIAYSYANKYYLFEVDYTSNSGIEDMKNVEEILNICQKSKKDIDSDKTYYFHKFVLSS